MAIRPPRPLAAVGAHLFSPALLPPRVTLSRPSLSTAALRSFPQPRPARFSTHNTHHAFSARHYSTGPPPPSDSTSSPQSEQPKTSTAAKAKAKIAAKLPTRLQTIAAWEFPSRSFTNKYPVLSFSFRLAFSAVLGLTVLGGVLLLHDSFTYAERHVDRVPTNPLSLQPRRGGKKNLPIIEANLDDEEDAKKLAMQDKPRLVIIGGGWGAVALLQTLPTEAYNVTLVSPQTYFAFTPLLPSACVGTVEPRSLVEPIRKLIARVRGHYLMGSAVDLDMAERLLEVEVPTDQGEGTQNVYLPYDKLVIAVGSTSNDHGVKGLEHCFQLKTIPDAQAIRRRIMGNLELASNPTTTPEERKRLLSFIVCGGGPTGVEFAAEVADMMAEDVLKYYPKILGNEVSIRVVQSRDHILNTYSEKISQYAEKRFAHNDVEIITNARVQEVFHDKVILTIKDPNNKHAEPSVVEVPSGFTLWSTGIAMQPFTKRLVELLPNQFHSKAVQVDGYLRVKGAPQGTIYAIGDASTIHSDMLPHLLELWEKHDKDGDDELSYDEWVSMAAEIRKSYPLASRYLGKLRSVFEEYDKNKDERLSLNECAFLFQSLSKKVTSLPATAQVASQQGKYLGRMFHKLAKDASTLKLNDMPDLNDEAYFEPFEYRHLGSLAYIGNSAVFDFEGLGSFTGGLIAMYAWRSIYWSEQTSMRTRLLLMLDWIKRGIFGRDLSKF